MSSDYLIPDFTEWQHCLSGNCWEICTIGIFNFGLSVLAKRLREILFLPKCYPWDCFTVLLIINRYLRRRRSGYRTFYQVCTLLYCRVAVGLPIL